MADAIASIALDASGYTAGEQQVAASNARLAQNARQTDEQINASRLVNEQNLNGSLLRGERRVATSSAFLATQLANVQSPAQAAALSIDFLSRSLRLGFGATVGIAFAYAAFTKLDESIAKTKEEADKLEKSLLADAKAATFATSGEGISSLGSKIEKLQADADAARKRSEELDVTAGTDIVQLAANRLKAARTNPLQDPDTTIAKELAEVTQKRVFAESEIARLRKLQFESASDDLSIQKAKLFGDEADAKLQELRIKQAKELKDAKALGIGGQALSDIQERQSNEQSEITKNAFLQKEAIESETRAAKFRGTAEQETLNTLKEQLKVAQEKAAFAQSTQKQAEADLDAAKAQKELDKFVSDTTFKHTQELDAAKALTEEMDLRARGEDRAAKLVETREKFEREIAADIHAGNIELADQAALQEKIAVAAQLGETLTRTAPQINQEAAQAAVLSNQQNVGLEAIKSALADIARGARLDASSPIAQAIKALDQPKPAAARTPETQQLETLNQTASQILARMPGEPSKGGGTGDNLDNIPTAEGVTVTGEPVSRADPRDTSRASEVSPPHDWTEFDKAFHNLAMITPDVIDPFIHDTVINPVTGLREPQAIHPISTAHDFTDFDNSFHTAAQGASKDFQDAFGTASKGASKDFQDDFDNSAPKLAKSLEDQIDTPAEPATAPPPSVAPTEPTAATPTLPDWSALEPKALPDWNALEPKALPDWNALEPKALPDWNALEPKALPDWSELKPLALPDFSSIDLTPLKGDFSGLRSLDGLTISIA